MGVIDPISHGDVANLAIRLAVGTARPVRPPGVRGSMAEATTANGGTRQALQSCHEPATAAELNSPSGVS